MKEALCRFYDKFRCAASTSLMDNLQLKHFHIEFTPEPLHPGTQGESLTARLVLELRRERLALPRVAKIR